MRLSVFRLAALIALVCLSWSFASPARADGVPAPMYDVNGALLIVGNDVCSGLPCTETIAFSFGFGYQYDSQYDYYQAFATDTQTSWSGVLGSFTSTSTGWGYLSTNGNYFPLFDASGDEVDINVGQNATATLPTAAPTFGAVLWSCYSATCLVDLDPFYTGPPPQGQADALGIISPVSGDFNLTAVPEPSGLPLLGVGLLALGVMVRRKRVTPV